MYHMKAGTLGAGPLQAAAHAAEGSVQKEHNIMNVWPNTTVTGTVTTPTSTKNASSATGAVLNQTGKPAIGTLSVTGTARDPRSVAAYADQLATVKGLTAPLISSVTSTDHTLTFTVDLIVTTEAFGGRYAVSPGTTSTGGH